MKKNKLNDTIEFLEEEELYIFIAMEKWYKDERELNKALNFTTLHPNPKDYIFKSFITI